MTGQRGGPVAGSLRLYRALARAFPHEFRSAYGEELLQVTEDAVEGVWRRRGVVGLTRLLADIALRVVVEHFAEIRRDIRYGLRTLAGSPGFTAVALISLALGIGVATSAFSELNGYVLRDVPAVREPGELAVVQGPTSYPNYKRYSERSDLFSGTLAYMAPVPFGVSLGGRTERTWGHLVTASYFPTLGVFPALGRAFRREDEQPGGAPIVVVSYRFWQNHLGADPSAVGKTVEVNGEPCILIGVVPAGFQGASPLVYGADLWLPLSVGSRVAPELAGDVLERYDREVLHVVARLRPGVAVSRAQAALDSVARQLELEYGDPERDQKGRRVTLLPGGKLVPIPKRDLPMLTGFMAVLGGMILLIAASNVANMVLARGTDRRKEIAVRLALGAGRGRLVRQLLTESMMIAAGAGVLGFLMASWVMRLASRMPLRFPMPLSLRLEPDGRVLLFTLGIPILRGRAFRQEDEADGSMAAIVSENLAQECWKGEEPLGRRFEIGNDEIPRFLLGGWSGERRAGVSGKTEVFEVVGVARNARDGLDMVPAEAPAVIYLPLRPADCARPSLNGVTLMVRGEPGIDATGAVRREVAAIDDRLTPFDARSMPAQIDQLLFPVRVALWTYGFIGVFGLILASVGLAGVTAYSVAQRRREIGIRVALGARGAEVLGLVMKEGVILVALGTVIGLALAWAGMRTLTGIMSEVARVAGTKTSDPLLLVGAPLLLAALALVACYLPARMSLRVDPAVTLRQE